jgi:uncharacterized cupredoxin-like copper-binding protein
MLTKFLGFQPLIPACVLLATLLSACGSGSGEPQRPAATPVATLAIAASTSSSNSTVTLHSNDFSFGLDRQSVRAGPVHFVMINDSKDYKHELWVFPQNQPRLQEMIKAKESGQKVSEADYVQGITGKSGEVQPGQTATFDAVLQPGVYDLACFVTSDIGGVQMNHYSMGMHTSLTVTAP